MGAVPPGTGIMVLATREVEIFNNTLVNNNTIEVAAVSYALIEAMNGLKSQEDEGAASSAQRFEEGANLDPEYDPYPGAIYIHDNTYGEVSWLPNLSNDFGKLFLWKFGFDRPQIIWDGMVPAQHLLSNGSLEPGL